MYEIIDNVNAWINENRAVALATVVNTWGSAPRGIGAKMAVAGDMAICGSVSGGCVENAVIEEAVESLKDGEPRLLHFGVSDDTAWSVGLACGGKIDVFVEPLDLAWWGTVTKQMEDNRPATTLIVLEGEFAGQKILVGEGGATLYVSEGLPDALAAASTSEERISRQLEIDGTSALVDVHSVKPRLVIIGGAHVSIALSSYAEILGFRVMIIDPRRTFASDERFPAIEEIYHGYPDKVFAQIGIDGETYVAVLTHDPKIDDPALIAALPSNAPYIGVLSSSRTHKKRLERLTKAGVDPSLFSRIHTPIGLNIGARTPEEIALAIMAEIIMVRNGTPA